MKDLIQLKTEQKERIKLTEEWFWNKEKHAKNYEKVEADFVRACETLNLNPDLKAISMKENFVEYVKLQGLEF